MAQYDDLTALNGLVKKVYGNKVHQAVPDGTKQFFSMFPFVPNQERLGAQFVEAISLSIEQGITRLTGTSGVQSLNNSIASSVQQAVVDGGQIILQCVLSWDVVAKARASNSPQAFENAMTRAVENTLLSHRRAQLMDLLYGSDPNGLGVISSGTASATQTITNASCAPGVWYGSTNMLVDIYDPTLTTKRNASPLSVSSYSVDFTGASRTITFNASVTTTTNDIILPSGVVSSGANTTPLGLAAIAGTQGGTLFGLSQTSYPVFQSPNYAVGGALTQAKLDEAATLPMTRGYVGKMNLLCHPITFSNLAMEQAGRIHLINGAVRGRYDVGFKAGSYLTASGVNVEIVGSPWIKEGTAYLVPDDGSVKRIGAFDIKLGGPGDPQPTWRRIESQTGYSLPTYSLQSLFTAEPYKIVKLTGIANT